MEDRGEEGKETATEGREHHLWFQSVIDYRIDGRCVHLLCMRLPSTEHYSDGVGLNCSVIRFTM